MGLLDKIFGKISNNKLTSNENNDLNQIPLTSEMLNEDKFWAIIENSLRNTTNEDEQELFLINEIGKLTIKEIIGFRLRTDKLLYDTYSSEMWCAAYIVNGGCSDDGFEYFRCWLISRGKEVYYKAKENTFWFGIAVLQLYPSLVSEFFWHTKFHRQESSLQSD